MFLRGSRPKCSGYRIQGDCIDNLYNVRRDASRHFRNKKKAYLKDEIEELETNTKINNVWDFYRIIYDFKKGTSLELL
jgi:hypothetical protein